MARYWLMDIKGFARKVKSASTPQVKDCGAKRACPNCYHQIDNSDVSPEWPGLPAGVKFDPTDVELLDHLASKCGVGDTKPHVFIDEFIPTLESDEGICYTHPENLPCAKKDGSSVHFFYRTINAYACGQRKRRKIHDENGVMNKAVRWHKTGKTKCVMDNGVQKGYKKIMVLYSASKSHGSSKHDKANWVMHQYHLGSDEDEREGEYVVSKIFYQQPKQNNASVDPDPDPDPPVVVVEDSDVGTGRTSPRTPNTATPQLPRSVNTPFDDVIDDYLFSNQDLEFVQEQTNHHPAPLGTQKEEPQEYATATCLAGESQAVEESLNAESLLCDEMIGSFAPVPNPAPTCYPCTSFCCKAAQLPSGIPELENIQLDTPPDFQLADLQFGSQDSLFDWLEKL